MYLTLNSAQLDIISRYVWNKPMNFVNKMNISFGYIHTAFIFDDLRSESLCVP